MRKFLPIALFLLACDSDGGDSGSGNEADSGSGDEADFDNVQACEDWLDSMNCGEFDFSKTADCVHFEENPCDLTDYFDCLFDNMVCDEKTGAPDMSGWSACMDYNSC